LYLSSGTQFATANDIDLCQHVSHGTLAEGERRINDIERCFRPFRKLQDREIDIIAAASVVRVSTRIDKVDKVRY
jgi:hypothetical protein